MNFWIGGLEVGVRMVPQVPAVMVMAWVEGLSILIG